MDQDPEQILARWERRAQVDEALLQAFLASRPQSIPCPYHPGITRSISAERTRDSRRCQEDAWEAKYDDCTECRAIEREDATRITLQKCGVPPLLTRCSLENWIAADEGERTNLAAVVEFTKGRKGFLILLGPVGCGKSHLAVAVMRHFEDRYDQYGEIIPGRLFVKQSTILAQLRHTYRDATAADPIAQCINPRLLVLDDMGFSGGGRDELPMLHEILDYRYGHKLPTIMTSNLPWTEFRDSLGERMADRLRESAFAVLTFSGSSHRPAQHERYFDQPEGRKP